MSDYTIKSLKDVEDSAAGRADRVEARSGRKHLDYERAIDAGSRLVSRVIVTLASRVALAMPR